MGPISDTVHKRMGTKIDQRGLVFQAPFCEYKGL